MMHTRPAAYYTPTARFLHWLMATIFILVWLIGFASAEVLSGAPHSTKGLLIGLHKNLATTLLFLVVIRIGWRYTHPVPALPDSMSPWLQRAAHIGHLLLYVLLIAMPLSGCIYSWSAGKSVPILYLFNLPPLVPENDAVFLIAKPLHRYLAWLCAALVTGHVLMALKHYFIDKDTVLMSMMGPRR